MRYLWQLLLRLWRWLLSLFRKRGMGIPLEIPLPVGRQGLR